MEQDSPSKKVALITGITGQDGSYLAELLLKKGYIVYGLIRRASNASSASRIEFIQEREDALEDPDEDDQDGSKVKLIYGDMTDMASIQEALRISKPDEIYNLAAQSHVGISFKNPLYTSNTVALGPLRLLEAVRKSDMADTVKVYQASSSEQYGDASPPQSETTGFRPRSPYAIAKHMAFQTFQNYREAYNMFCVNGILFNHESPRRGTSFVTRKITRNVAMIHLGLSSKMELGNVYSKRDWGHARDYVEGMWMMMQQDRSDDYVLATGVEYTIKEFAEMAFREIGETLTWEGSGASEVAKNQNGVIRISVNPKLYRATEVAYLLGDSTKARTKLGWSPKTTVPMMVKEMVQNDTEELKRGSKYAALLRKKEAGDSTPPSKFRRCTNKFDSKVAELH